MIIWEYNSVHSAVISGHCHYIEKFLWSLTERPLSSLRNKKISPQKGSKKKNFILRGDKYFFVCVENTVAQERKPTSHFLTAFNFSLSSFSVSFSPTHPPSPLAFLSPLSAPQWPSPTQSLEQCEWETKAIKCTHAHIPVHVQVRTTAVEHNACM